MAVEPGAQVRAASIVIVCSSGRTAAVAPSCEEQTYFSNALEMNGTQSEPGNKRNGGGDGPNSKPKRTH